MADPAEEDRLKRLEERIAAVRKTAAPKPKPRVETNLSQANYAWRMVTELVAGLAIGFGIGYTVDAWFGTRPWFLVLFILLGFGAGVNVMLRTAKELQKQAGQPAQDREAETSADKAEAGNPAGGERD
ncbi:AtpZ/AtpI family protein [Acidimangrovimonas sediminis]|uniref:AtpZ/AtpI family protein n=1 Tax=Acidimangrovimonas sediminis TaxID=2056283 RepID=UPI000C80F606|nr:AtpZ/AtpI family protein [Acidimangrovimonas sediminis]